MYWYIVIYNYVVVVGVNWRVSFKIIHSIKNLFCYVALICNLVQEFNGLVSKGSAVLLALLLFKKLLFFSTNSIPHLNTLNLHPFNFSFSWSQQSKLLFFVPTADMNRQNGPVNVLHVINGTRWWRKSSSKTTSSKKIPGKQFPMIKLLQRPLRSTKL